MDASSSPESSPSEAPSPAEPAAQASGASSQRSVAVYDTPSEETAPGETAPKKASAWGRPDAFEEVAPGMARIEIGFVNAYALGEPGGPWVLVDTGLPRAEALVRRAARKRFGRGADAIVLTHGHFDHSGNAQALADAWGAPVYAHAAELPFLTGRSDYPPQDPTPGGAICFLSRFFPHHRYHLGRRVRALPESGETPESGAVPKLPGWQWIHTPGHTPGHVSLFREEDGTLLAGDALATMDLDSWATQLTHKQRLSRPPTPFTPDWRAARESLERLAELAPARIGAGHGPPLAAADTAERLRHFVEHRFEAPRKGRYVGDPIEANAEEGVTYVPPPASDPTPGLLGAGAALAGGFALGAALARLLTKSPDAKAKQRRVRRRRRLRGRPHYEEQRAEHRRGYEPSDATPVPRAEEDVRPADGEVVIEDGFVEDSFVKEGLAEDGFAKDDPAGDDEPRHRRELRDR